MHREGLGLDRYVRRVIEVWSDLSPVRKGMLTATAIGLVALLVFFFSWSSHTTYMPLYTDLSSADSGAITSQLSSQGVPYQLTAGGATILVPEKQVDQLRVNFASQGLPQGGHVGFEIFNGNSLTATDFVQKINFQRGLEGELERTIETFSAVDHSRVHLVLPQQSLFKNDQQPTTASVVLQLHPGRQLADNEVNGIALLVSDAVEGLDKKNITVLDTAGSILYDGTDAAGSGFGATAHQLDLQHQYEQSIQRDIQSTLDQALGPGKALVTVRALLGFDQVQTQSETYTPVTVTPAAGATAAAGTSTTPAGVAVSSTNTTETYTTNGNGTTGAAPGAVANVPGANASLPSTVTAGASTAASTSYQRSDTTSNYDVNKTTTSTVAATGDLKRLSVSLLLDDTVTDAQATALEKTVSAAAGIDTTRGDTVVVNRVPFDHSAVDAANAAFKSEAATNQLLSYVRLGLPVLMLLVGFIFFRLLMRSVSRRAYRVYAPGEYPQGMAQLPAGAGPADQAAFALAQAANARGLPEPDVDIKKSDSRDPGRTAGHRPPGDRRRGRPVLAA